MKLRIKILILGLFLIIAFQPTVSQNLRWDVVGTMPIPTSGGKAIVRDSLIYILGGFSDSLGMPLDVIQEYNPATNTWRVIEKMNSRRRAFFAARYKDSIIICGGSSGSPSIFSSLEVWNFKSKPYIYSINPNFNRMFFAGHVIGNKLYLIGGVKSMPDMYRLPFIIEYDIFRDSITYKEDSLFPNVQLPFHLMTSVLNNNIFIFGGVFFGISPKIFRFNSITKIFEKLPIELLQPRAGGDAINLNDDSIIIIGGYNEAYKTLSTVEIFTASPGTLSIKIGPPLNYARRDLIAVRFRNTIYVFGGENALRENVAQVEKLDLLTDVETDEHESINDFKLYNNYPNPFSAGDGSASGGNPNTTISFKIGKKSNVSLDIYSILGEQIVTLTNQEYSPGEYSIRWNGKDKNGNLVNSGVYIYKLTTEFFIDTKKMLMFR